MSKNKSIFSKIIDREIPAEIIYEDDLVIAFLDAFPHKPGHFLVVPKKQEVNMIEQDEASFIHAMKIARKLAKERVLGSNIPGFRLLVNTGKSAGQTVFHTHIHIIPYAEEEKTPEHTI